MAFCDAHKPYVERPTAASAESDPYLNAVTDPANRRMRTASGQVDHSRPLVTFLYKLGRDHLPLGVIEGVIREGEAHGAAQFTNGWLAQWAVYAADRLTPGSPGPGRTLLDALLEDAEAHEAAGRFMEAANARAAVENLRDVPPWGSAHVNSCPATVATRVVGALLTVVTELRNRDNARWCPADAAVTQAVEDGEVLMVKLGRWCPTGG